MRLVAALSLLMCVTSCDPKRESGTGTNHPEANLQNLRNEGDVEKLLNKGMTKEEVERTLGDSYIVSYDGDEEILSYFLSDGKQLVKEGELIGLHVILKSGLVQEWASEFYGGSTNP